MATKGISFGYDPIGDITSIERYTNITQAPNPSTDAADTTLTYNNLGQLTSEDHTHYQSAIENLSWTFDTLGRVSTFSSNDGLATYGYDRASQVVSATYSGSSPPPNFSTTYDPNGVRNASGDTVGPNNHLTSDGTFNFVYDNEGNLIKRTRISTAQANDHEVDYSWDYRNRLTDAYFYNNSSVLTQHIHYVYDVFDHLIERDVDPTGGGTYTQVAHYVWDISSSSPLPLGEGQGEGSSLGAGEGGVVLEFNGQQQLTNRYLNGPNASASDSFFSTLAEEAVSSLASPGTVTFDLNDNQGSVRNVVDANGNLLDHINYTFDGQVASESNPSSPHLPSYAGGLLDPATQMLNEYRRWLVLADGFWASADPLGLLAGDTNVTRYVGNSAPNYTDPSGLKGELDLVMAEAKRRGLPTLILEALKTTGQLSFSGGAEDGQENYNHSNGTISLTDRRLAALRQGNLKFSDLALIYQELFHAYMARVVYPAAKKGGKCAWLVDLMNAENYAKVRGDRPTAMAEEAMSDVFDAMVAKLAWPNLDENGRPRLNKSGLPLPGALPTYESDNAAPGHEESTFKSVAGISAATDPQGRKGPKDKLSPSLFFATLYLLYNGCRDPAPGAPLSAKRAMLANWYSLRFGLTRPMSTAELAPGSAPAANFKPPIGSFPLDVPPRPISPRE